MCKSLDGDLTERVVRGNPTTSTPRKTEREHETSARQPGSFVNPVVRGYYDSPFVTAAAEYQDEVRQQEERERRRRARASEKCRARGRGYQVASSSSEDAEENLDIPTTVRFRDRIKTFQKFNKPDGNQTWIDFLQQLVELLKSYKVLSREWAAWLIDRLTGKAQAALLNLTPDQRGDWASLVSAVNSHFHVEYEMCAAEEELLTRKQGTKESVRDFITQLRFLARKAYGQDLEKREAAVIKCLELGLGTSSLRRTYDDMIGQPGVTLSVLTSELVRWESRDDPGRYTQYVAQKREVENTKKPKNPSTATQVRQIMQEVLLAQGIGIEGGATGGINSALGPTGKPRDTSAPRGGSAARGRGRGRRGRGRSAARGSSKDGGDQEVVSWHCDQVGHYRTSCPRATPEEKEQWQQRATASEWGGGRGSKPAKESAPADSEQKQGN
jgi:hypothetical protein